MRRVFAAIDEIFKLVRVLLAGCLIVLGIAIFFLPIPIGAIMIMLGLLWILGESPVARKVLRALRRKYGWLDRFFARHSHRLPPGLQKIETSTRPEHG